MDELHAVLLGHCQTVFNVADRTCAHHSTDKDTVRRSIRELEKLNRWMFDHIESIDPVGFEEILEHLTGEYSFYLLTVNIASPS